MSHALATMRVKDEPAKIKAVGVEKLSSFMSQGQEKK